MPVAELDGVVVGVGEVLVLPRFPYTGGCGELESVHVRGVRRGRGIGALLLAAAGATAHERGGYRMQLTSRNVREDAYWLYRREGSEWTSQDFKK